MDAPPPPVGPDLRVRQDDLEKDVVLRITFQGNCRHEKNKVFNLVHFDQSTGVSTLCFKFHKFLTPNFIKPPRRNPHPLRAGPASNSFATTDISKFESVARKEAKF